ncbi:4-hydroxybenzoyl-CoA thioesterase [Blastomonas natatoria]|uniref:4-hydroxybenzoyl-CoA thioesterase n=1 Tax=Blastomonas natatoria TaxID=34015 RepID=A0A2V3UYR1_9SPHN|nr:thioesterase family protein [Blastomonas natatoria]PXW74457.1 4-hydroxybenzoyl-CoA thioesterase [Blastomonas natatoria]
MQVLELPVRFAHVDAAGIVFYPRYFEMLNAAVEQYFADIVGVDFRQMHLDRHIGVPTVHLEADFAVPSRLGDRLSIDLIVDKVGRSSCAIRYVIRCADEVRMRASATLVCMDLVKASAVPWPDDMRARMLVEASG